MTQKTNLLLFSAIATILLASSFALNEVFAAKGEPNGQPFQELQSQINELDQRIDDIEPDPRVDSFFDVFFDVELYSVDSFFDVFTEVQTSTAQSDSFFDVFFEVDTQTADSFFDIFTDLGEDRTAEIDSFFDVFVEIDARDEHFETEIVALDLRGDSIEGQIAQEISDRQAGDAQLQQKTTDNMEGIGTIQTQIDDLQLVSHRPPLVGPGLIKSSGTLLVDFLQVQHEVLEAVDACPVNQSIRTINADGTVVCQAVGTDQAVMAFHNRATDSLVDDGGLPDVIPGLSQTITVDDSQDTVFVTASVQASNNGDVTGTVRSIATIVINGNLVQQGPVSKVGFNVNDQMGAYVNWSGTLTAGTHTIEIKTLQNTEGDKGVTYCVVESRCSMDVLQFK